MNILACMRRASGSRAGGRGDLRARCRGVFALLVVVVFLPSSCADPGHRASDGSDDLAHLAAEFASRGLLSAPGFTVVLLVDPTDCLTCATPLAQWSAWGRDHPHRLHVAFLGVPTDRERRLLTPLRLVPDQDHILADGRRVPTPLELVFRDGELLYADTLLPNQPNSPLLALLDGDRPIADVLGDRTPVVGITKPDPVALSGR